MTAIICTSERMAAVEALAEAWASIDGKLKDFAAGRESDEIDAFGGHYAGYLADAMSMIDRLEKRGFTVRRTGPVIAPPKGEP